MKIVIYLLSGVLIAPGSALAYFLWTVDEATRQKNIFHLLFFVFDRFIESLHWGMVLVFPAMIVWLTLAFITKYRFIGASGMVLIALVSIIVMFVTVGPQRFLDGCFIPLISAIGLAGNTWLIWKDFSATSAH